MPLDRHTLEAKFRQLDAEAEQVKIQLQSAIGDVNRTAHKYDMAIVRRNALFDMQARLSALMKQINEIK